MIALAWVFVAVALPLVPGLADSNGKGLATVFLAPPTLLAAGAVFALSFAASTALSLGDVQSDRLIGRETVAMLVGRGPARAIAAACAGIVALGTGVPAVIGWVPVAGLGFSFAGLMVLVATLSRRRTGDSLRFGLGVQFSLLAAGPVGMLAEVLTLS
jgi:4-hydroxybenzoate polyprenyltransferase